MRAAVILLLVLGSAAARADRFEWMPGVETENVVTEGDLTVWRRSQPGGSSYLDLEVWVERSGLHQTVFFGKCAGGVVVKVDGDDLIVTERCAKYDEDERTTRWRWNDAKHRFDEGVAETRNHYRIRTKPVRALLAKGELIAALARLEEVGVEEMGGNRDHTYRWAEAFLEAGVEHADVKGLRAVITSPLLGAAAGELEQPHLLNEVAFVLYEGGENDIAIVLLRRVVELDPRRVVARLNLADALWKRGGTWRDEAKTHYRAYRDGRGKGKVPARVTRRLK